ncbi:MAG: hypothetical protein WBE10_12505, partial [Candidatus Acidiferrum sp.]
EVTEFAINYYPQTGEDSAPSYYTSGYPQKMRDEYVAEWHKEHDPVPGKEPTLEGYSYRGDSWDDEKPHLWRYFQSVKSRQPVTEDVVFGNNAALACHMANQSYFRLSAVAWDPASGTIKSL